MIASCGFQEDELRQCSTEEGVTSADSVETLGVDLRTRVKRLGATEQARRKKCKVRFAIIKKNEGLPEELHEGGCQEVVTSGHVPARTWESMQWSSHGKIYIEETDGSSSGQKQYDIVVLVHGSRWSGG